MLNLTPGEYEALAEAADAVGEESPPAYARVLVLRALRRRRSR